MNVIYIGDRVNLSGTLNSVFLHGKKELHFSKMSHHQIGVTYILKQNKDKTYQFKKYGLQESNRQKLVEEKQVKDWSKEHDLSRSEAAMIRERKKILNKSDWVEALEPIAEEYSTARGNRRYAIELSLVAYLRNYFPKEGT